MAVSLKKSWDTISESYQKEFYGRAWGAKKFTSHPRDFLINVRGKKIIELGCGAGQGAIALSKKGAIVTAIDFSEKQIWYGKQLAAKENVKVNFIVGDLNKLEKYFSKNQFDIAYSSYAFQYVEDLNKFFAAVNKILRKNGMFVFGLDHPIWTCGEWVKIGKKDVYVIKDYFKRRKIFWTWKFKKGVHANFYLYHHTLEDFFSALAKNGFVIEIVTEPYPVEKNPSVHKRHFSFSKMRASPYTIVFKTRKK